MKTIEERKAGLEDDVRSLGIDDLLYWIDAIEEHIERPVVRKNATELSTMTTRLSALRCEADRRRQ